MKQKSETSSKLLHRISMFLRLFKKKNEENELKLTLKFFKKKKRKQIKEGKHNSILANQTKNKIKQKETIFHKKQINAN